MDCSVPGSSVYGDSPGKNTGADCHALLQGIFPTQPRDGTRVSCSCIARAIVDCGFFTTKPSGKPSRCTCSKAISYGIPSECARMEQTGESYATLSTLVPSRRQDWEVELKHSTFYFQHFGTVWILRKSTESRSMRKESIESECSVYGGISPGSIRATQMFQKGDMRVITSFLFFSWVFMAAHRIFF